MLTGRGGAGNVVSEPNAAAHEQGKPQDLEAGDSGPQMTATEAAASVAAASHHQHGPGGMLGGRGGAGNWHDTSAEAARAEAENEVEDSARNEKMARDTVDGSLQRPEPTHYRIRHSERRHR